MADALGYLTQDPRQPYKGEGGDREEQQDRRLLQKVLQYYDPDGKKDRHAIGDSAYQQAPRGRINMAGIL